MGARRVAWANGLRVAAWWLAWSVGSALAQPTGAAVGTPVLGLPQALARALPRDPQVQAARALLEAVRAQTRQARSRLWPSAGVSVTQGRDVDDDSPLALGRTIRRSDAFLRWNLFNGLDDRRQIDARQLDEAAAEAELLRVLDEACERLGSAYFELLRQQHRSAYAQQRLAEVDAIAQRVARQSALGKLSDADAQLAAAYRIDAQLALEAARADHAAAQSQLRVLVGDAGGLALRVAEAAAPPVDTAMPLDQWWDEARQHNGQWMAAAARVTAARARVASVEPEYLPRVDLDLRRRLHDSSVPVATSMQRRGWSLALTYEVPLGGGPAARGDEMRARVQAAEAELERVRDAVRAELGVVREQALQAMRSAPQLRQQLGYLDEVVRAGELQFDAGRRNLMQLIEQLDRRYAAQQQDVDNRWRAATSQLRLRRLVGALAEDLDTGAAALQVAPVPAGAAFKEPAAP